MMDRLVTAAGRDLIQSARIQSRVIRALMIREAIGRFGHENLGFFWLFIEPLMLSFAVMVMWAMTGLHQGQGIGIVPFVLASYSLLTLWRHICSSSVRVLRRHSNFLYHRHVKLLDIITARVALDSLGGLAGFTVAYIVLGILGYIDMFKDPLASAGAWLLMSWFGWSFSLVLAGLTEMFEPAEHFVGPFLYITLPLTGAFYMVLWLPGSAQAAVMWSPLVHIFEMFRGGLFGAHVSAEWSVLYVVGWCFGLMAIGLPLLRIAQTRFISN